MCTSGSRPHRVRGQRYTGLEACKIEKEIENFVENFKKKGSALDQPPTLERPPSLESCSSSLSRSSRPSSSLYSSDFTDESPEKTAYLMPEIVRRYRYCSTTTTSDSEGAEDDFRRLMIAYKDSKRHTAGSSHTVGSRTGSLTHTLDTATSSNTEGPDGFAGKSELTVYKFLVHNVKEIFFLHVDLGVFQQLYHCLKSFWNDFQGQMNSTHLVIITILI